MSIFLIFCLYYMLRMHIDQVIIPNAELMKKGEQKTEFAIMWVFFNTFMLLSSIQKLLYYMRLREGTSVLANLVMNVFQQAATFSLFYLIWVIFICMIFTVAGTTFDTDDYPGLSNTLAQFI